MKEFIAKVKEKLPLYKEKFFKSINVLIIYQALLFLIAPTLTNQILLVLILVLFVVNTVMHSKSS